MYSFTAVNDIDLDYYEYELYNNSTGAGSPIKTGRAKANVFTVAVTNSSDSVITTYSGRVRTVSTSGAQSSWSNIVASGNTPLIESQYINSLTANKITAGTIGAHTITLNGSNSILKSSTYNLTQGWQIDGAGNATFNTATLRGEFSSGTSPNWFRVDNAGNIWSGADTYNNASSKFRVSNSGSLTAASGTIGGWTIGTSAITSSNGLVTLASSGDLSIGTSATNKATITSTGDFTVIGDGGGSYGVGTATFFGPWYQVKKGSNPSSTTVPFAQLTYKDFTFFTDSNGGYKVFIGGGNDDNTAFIDVGATGITAANSISCAGGVFGLSGVYVQNGGTVGANTSFATTGSSTTARLASGSIIFGYDAIGRPSSLRELKENITDIENALSILSTLKPRKYNFKADAFSELDPTTNQAWTQEAKDFAALDHKYGFIVDEVLSTNPDLISYVFDPEGEENLNYLDFSKWKPSMWEDIDVLVLCVKAIQELHQKIGELESRLI